jgi:hypothetical protein
MDGKDKNSTYSRSFLEILDVMVTNISGQFSDIPKLKMFNLLDQKRCTRLKTGFPAYAVCCLTQNYGVLFDSARLRSELTVVYSDPEFSRSEYGLNEYIRTQELHDVFPETTTAKRF